MAKHSKARHRPTPGAHDEEDPDLEAAIKDLRRRYAPFITGRCTLELERLGRVTIGHRVTTDGITTREVEQTMAQMPRKPRPKAGQA